ncbi:MAG: hypothetical protein OXF56_10005 [Rhodobacteraceae bacterium]|nr:hypothetical protein [Paracoccaceae bacterium]
MPNSVIKRLELLSGDSQGTPGGNAFSGAINVVLRKDLNGFETRALTWLPDQDGGDGFHGSVFRVGAVGEGRMPVGGAPSFSRSTCGSEGPGRDGHFGVP